MAERNNDGSEREPSSQPSQQEDYFSQDIGSSSRTYQSRRLDPLDPVRARLGAEPGGGSPTSPRTPRTPVLGRSTSSAFNSPGQGFRADDEYFIFEFGSRYLRAGLGGESQPRCVLDFAPKTQKRAGDYSQWLSRANSPASDAADNFDSWGQDYVLWHMDLRGADSGLFADKMERALRHAIVDYLLILDDSKKRKFILAVPSIIPHPLLTSTLSALFNVFAPPPSIILLSSAVLCSIAAGLRSALVVDIGWSGTSVSPIYEYREVQLNTSTRGMKLLSWEVRNLLKSKLQAEESTGESTVSVSFADTEEVLNRMIWCSKRTSTQPFDKTSSQDSTIHIPLKTSHPAKTLSIPFQQFSYPPETALICSNEDDETTYDDDELPLPLLLFKSLLSLPIDVRQMCQSRIVITGGGSNIPGLKGRLLDELSCIVSVRGWDPVANYGSAKNPKRRPFGAHNGTKLVNENTKPESIANGHVNKDLDPTTTSATYQQPPLPDPILTTIRSKVSTNKPQADVSASQEASEEAESPDATMSTDKSAQSKIHGAQTLGAWAGASLVGGLRIRSMVEIDREKFMQHGLPTSAQAATAASKRQSMAAASSQRQSLIGGSSTAALGKPGDRESGTWTLGVWA